MYQQTIVIGHVGQDPEMKYTPQGIAVCNFSVAVTEKWGKGDQRQEKTTWFRVVCWREKAEVASQYIHKGSKVMVIGGVKATAYMDKNGKPAASLELTATEFKFLDSKSDNNGGRADNETDYAPHQPEETNDFAF